MSKKLNRLSARFVATVTKKGTYADGGGLFLQVGIGGNAKSWIYIYRRIRFAAEDSFASFTAALEQAGHTVPQHGDRTTKLLPIANAIIKEHTRDVAAHKVAYESGERKKSELVQAAEHFADARRRGYAGLGSTNAVSLAAARVAGQKCREWLAAGKDPRTELEREKREAAAALVNTSATFLNMGNEWITARATDAEKPWRQSTREGHENRLNFHLKPLHNLLVTEITANHIYEIIHPLRQAGHKSTAHKVRMQAENIIAWAKARKTFPATEINPASMEGDLRILLNTNDTQPISTPLLSLHYTKLPALYAKVSALIAARPWLTLGEVSRVTGKGREYLYNMIRCGRLQATKAERPDFPNSIETWQVDPAEVSRVAIREGWTLADLPLALPPVQVFILLYQILCACRPGEARGMRWSEWDETNQMWDVPWQRLRNGSRLRLDHHLPLSKPAIVILNTMREKQKQDKIDDTEFVFANYLVPNPTSGRLGIPPAHNTVRNLLRNNLSNADADKTLHGMRTSFGSWARQLGYVEADIERALSHIKGYGNVHVARLYTRDATRDVPLRKLFADWAHYCLTGELPAEVIPAEIIPIRRPIIVS
jgi:integrase